MQEEMQEERKRRRGPALAAMLLHPRGGRSTRDPAAWHGYAGPELAIAAWPRWERNPSSA